MIMFVGAIIYIFELNETSRVWYEVQRLVLSYGHEVNSMMYDVYTLAIGEHELVGTYANATVDSIVGVGE